MYILENQKQVEWRCGR